MAERDTAATTSVPRPGALVTVSRAPIAAARSRIPTSPQWPPPSAAGQVIVHDVDDRLQSGQTSACLVDGQ